MQGWLKKQGRRFKTWKWRYFVLRADTLCYYTDKNMQTLKGSMKITPGAKIVIQMGLEYDQFHFIVYTDARKLLISCPTRDLMQKWVDSIQSAIPVVKQPQHDNVKLQPIWQPIKLTY